MLKQLKNVTVVLPQHNPYVLDSNNNIILSDYYKFRPMKQSYNVKLSKTFAYDVLYYIPCESNIYHATVFSAFYLSLLPNDALVLTNNCKVFTFYANHFNIKLCDTPGHYKVNKLYYFEMNGPIYTTPSRFDVYAFKHFIFSTKPLCKVDKHLPKRIYIKRNTQHRTVENSACFEQMLQTKGFRIVCMENYDLQDQIDMYSNADCIIAVHGAGLTNIIYCKLNCIIVELKHKGMNCFLIHNCYAQLAEMSKLENYNVYYTQYKEINNCKSKDYNLSIDVKALSIQLDILLKRL